MGLAGLVVGLGVAEGVFWIRDGGGYPKLAIYREDPVLGVRLLPGASQRLVYPDNPPTRVRINREGYRGADFTAPGPDDVVVVGDSQVFGLGVEEDQTFAAVLAQTLGGTRKVLNGGVPTYGPAEYAAVARELISRHHPRTVVFTVNLVNDLFEVARPNRERHVVRDGWAVRREAAAETTEFPGRSWLAGHSHLFYALRQLWHRDTEGQSVASEGTWKDLVDTGARSAAQQAAAQQQRKERTAALRQTEDELSAKTAEIDRAIAQLLIDELSTVDQVALDAAHRLPGDLVDDPFQGTEEARPVVVTAAQIRHGAVLRARLRGKLAALARNHTQGKEREAILASLDAQPRLATRLDELVLARVRAALETPLAPVIRELKRSCEEQGVRLVVLVLPIDVAVSDQEWKKYHATPIDMSSVAALGDELVELGAELGISTLDATAALRAAEPGAFLDHDIHMTPRGHRAVAAELAKVLAAAPPPPRGDHELPPLPVPAQWNAAPEIVVAGSTEARCETKIIREWLRVLCVSQPYENDAPTAIEVTQDGTQGAMVMVMPQSAALLVPLRRGAELSADFVWSDVRRRLTVRWPQAAAAATAAFEGIGRSSPEPSYQRERPFASELARATCACWGTVYPPNFGFDPKRPQCPGIYGDPAPGCQAYRASCTEMVACLLRDPSSPPRASAGGPP